MEVRIKRDTLQQKRLWVETVDLAFNAWNQQEQTGNITNVAGSVRFAYEHVAMEDAVQGFVRNQHDYEGVSTLAQAQFLTLVKTFLKFYCETNIHYTLLATIEF